MEEDIKESDLRRSCVKRVRPISDSKLSITYALRLKSKPPSEHEGGVFLVKLHVFPSLRIPVDIFRPD